MRFQLLLVAVALLLGSHAASDLARADFAGVSGFSGRVADCTACHTPSPLADAAEVHLDGLPDGWLPGETYPLEVRVTGGPPALPAPQPQGGFELETSHGSLSPAPGMEGLLRTPAPTIATYLPAGTQMRNWSVLWHAPDLSARPETVGFWLAGIAANGNHVVATNASDGGEHGDQVATLTATAPAHPDAEAAWLALPLRPPTVDPPGPGATTLVGHHADANATTLAWRLAGGDWQRRDTGPSWRLRLEDAAPGTVVELRSEGAGRTSPSLHVAAREDGAVVLDAPPAPAKDASLPFLLPVAAVAAALTLSRRRP